MSSSPVAYPHGPADLSALQPVLETALDAVIVMDASGLVLDWNLRAQETFGWTREEAIRQPVASLIIPQAMRAAHKAGLERLVETGETRILDRRLELTGLHRDGREIPVELSITQWRDRKGESVFLGFLRDISEARRAADALRASEERLRVTQEVAQVGIAETDRDGRFLRVNPAFCAITGYQAEELVGQKTFSEITHPDSRDDDRSAYGRQVAGEPKPYQVDKRFFRKDGEVAWANVSASAAYDAEGRFLYGIRVLQDINERKLGEARQQLLLNELNHRVKNILALVRALAVQTGRAVSDTETFNAVFQERLGALAKSHDLLIRDDWRGTGLREVLDCELGPYASRNGRLAVLLDGPAVRLDARECVGLCLIVHELATNAAKYGALSAAEGAVTLTWRWIEGAGPPLLRLTWTERGGPPVVEPTRRGFGSQLIERLARGDLGGEVAFEYDPKGLEVAMTICPHASH